MPRAEGRVDAEAREAVIRVVIESPYAGHVGKNLSYLSDALRDCLLRGEAPFASHGLYTRIGVLDDNDLRERELGIKAGFLWRSVAEKTVVYTDLGISLGMKFGIEHSLSIGIPIEYRSLPQWKKE